MLLKLTLTLKFSSGNNYDVTIYRCCNFNRVSLQCNIYISLKHPTNYADITTFDRYVL